MKIFLLTSIALLLMSLHAHAAVLSVEAPATLRAGEQFTVDIAIDPEMEELNAFDISVLFPSQLFLYKGYTMSTGAIPLWIISPQQQSDTTIHFSGIIPGGIERLYDPEHRFEYKVRLVRLLFEATVPGTATIAITDSQVLRNDGYGTSVATTTRPATVTVVERKAEEAVPVVTTPGPRSFEIRILEKSPLGKTPRMVMFISPDDIDHYEVYTNNAWQRVENPYPLPNRIFPYGVRVRAVDFSGTYQERVVRVRGEHFDILAGGMVLLVSLLILFFLNRKQD